MSKNSTISITCYNKTTNYPESKRKELINKFTIAARCCDGSESERYWRIVDGLTLGMTEISDEPKEYTHEEIMTFLLQ